VIGDGCPASLVAREGAVRGRRGVLGESKGVLAGGNGAGGHEDQKRCKNKAVAYHIVQVSLKALLFRSGRPFSDG